MDINKQLLDEIVKREMNKRKKIIQKKASISLDEFIESKQFQSIVKKSVKDIICDWLFDDLDWMPVKEMKEMISKRVLRAMK